MKHGKSSHYNASPVALSYSVPLARHLPMTARYHRVFLHVAFRGKVDP